MNDYTLNAGECPYCHGFVDQFGPTYQCRRCLAYGLSLEALQEYTRHWDDPEPTTKGATS